MNTSEDIIIPALTQESMTSQGTGLSPLLCLQNQMSLLTSFSHSSPNQKLTKWWTWGTF